MVKPVYSGPEDFKSQIGACRLSPPRSSRPSNATREPNDSKVASQPRMPIVSCIFETKLITIFGLMLAFGTISWHLWSHIWNHIQVHSLTTIWANTYFRVRHQRMAFHETWHAESHGSNRLWSRNCAHMVQDETSNGTQMA